MEFAVDTKRTNKSSLYNSPFTLRPLYNVKRRESINLILTSFPHTDFFLSLFSLSIPGTIRISHNFPIQ